MQMVYPMTQATDTASEGIASTFALHMYQVITVLTFLVSLVLALQMRNRHCNALPGVT